MVTTLTRRYTHMSPLAANRSGNDPLLYTTPNCHVKKGYPNTDGVNSALSSNRFAAKRHACFMLFGLRYNESDIKVPGSLYPPVNATNISLNDQVRIGPLLYTTPNSHVKKGYPNTDGVNNVLSTQPTSA